MADLSLDKLKPLVAESIKPFLDDVLNKYHGAVHSIHITGTAVTDDFDSKTSDINSIFVLKEMDFYFLEVLAPLGKKYGKDRVAAPLIMTPEYIEKSLDVFPVEFLNFKLIHSTVFGEDIFEYLEIHRMALRLQCERELKSKLIWLRQRYLSSAGDSKLLTQNILSSISGYIPLFRGIIILHGKQPPVRQSDVISNLSEETGINTSSFAKVLMAKHDKGKFSDEELNAIFRDCYSATGKLGKIIDEIEE
ncbi:MAG: hypothetical protein HY758_01390 [Nitrospirae bacterium]|nr:hypothetical protein [Nitrospirota bacterium]